MSELAASAMGDPAKELHSNKLDATQGKYSKDFKDGKDGKDAKEYKDGKDAKDFKDGKDGKDAKEYKDGKDSKDFKDSKDSYDGQAPQLGGTEAERSARVADSTRLAVSAGPERDRPVDLGAMKPPVLLMCAPIV